MSTTRFPFGVTNVKKGTTLGSMGQLDPSKYFTIFDDLVIAPTSWGTLTAIDGAGGLATTATTVAAATPKKSILLNSQKAFFMKFNLSLAAIASTTINMGAVDSFSAITTGVYLSLVNGVTLSLKITGTGTTTDSITVNVPATTMTSLGISYIPGSGFKVYLNDVLVLSEKDITNFPSAALLFGAIGTGTTVTHDYFFFAQER